MTIITFVDYASSTTDTISMPAGIAAGDIAILYDAAFDTGSAPASVYPSGFTAIGTSQTSVSALGVRFNVSRKILTGSETTVTGMNGAVAVEKLLLVFRKSGGDWHAPGSISAEASALASVSDQTVTVGTGAMVVLGAVMGQSGFVLSMSPAADATKQGDVSFEAGYKIYDSSPADKIGRAHV